MKRAAIVRKRDLPAGVGHPPWSGLAAHNLRFSDEIAEQIIEHVRAGVPLNVAAARAYIAPSTLKRWRARGAEYLSGEGPEEYAPYAWFAAELDKAKADFLAYCVVRLRESDNVIWRKWASILSRRDRENWAPTVRLGTEEDYEETDEFL